MATVTKQGRGYKITVSFGFDGAGQRRREHMTWIPDPKLTARQLEKELNRQVVLFEERVRTGANAVDGSIRFGEWTKKYLEECAPSLKAHTVARYTQQLEIANKAIGHIKLKDLKPGHIAKFYANLQEEGVRGTEAALVKLDLSAWCKAHKTSLWQLGQLAGISPSVRQKLKAGRPIKKEKALAIAAAMGESPDTVFRFERDMTPLRATSVLSYHRALSTALSHAVEQGYIPLNPASKVRLPKDDSAEPAYLDEPDARRVLELLQHEHIRWKTLIAFDLLSGLRRAEILGLRWSDIDLDHGLVHIRQTWNYLPSKGCFTDSPKSRTSQRPLRISRSAVMLLLDYKAWQDKQREQMGDAWNPSDGRVFTGDDGTPIFPDSVTKWFKDFVRKNELPNVHIHSLRHTYASLQIAEGTPLIVVSRNLGHAKASTTSNIYAHVIASAEAKATEVMDRFADVLDGSGTNVALNPKKTHSA